ncbi:MAG: hypothetical protein JWN73_3174 [Betaproteobacteria bacterium]|nr:hypothetical protein [Betaproteobacteria bacterium]
MPGGTVAVRPSRRAYILGPMPNAPARSHSADCVIVERPGELLIRMRGLARVKGVVMLGVLLPFLLFLMWIKGFSVVSVVFALAMAYVGSLFALNWSRLTATPAQLRTSFGPVPMPLIGRVRITQVADVLEISCSETRTVMARGGVMVRYAVQAWTGAAKPVFLLDAEIEQDASAAAVTLVGWLNANRGEHGRVVTLR